MANDTAGNYIRAHRRRLGLTQRQLGALIGYGNGYAVSRHERGKVVPPLSVALAYEVALGIPVARIFNGIHSAASTSVTQNQQKFLAGRNRAALNQSTLGGDAT